MDLPRTRITPSSMSLGEPLEIGKKRKNWSCYKYLLLMSVALVFALCGALLTLRFIFKGYYENLAGHKDKISSKSNSHIESLPYYHCTAACSTEDCIKTAAIMLNMMDSEADPCDDFYRYVCGGYNKVMMRDRRRNKEFYINDVAEEIPKVLENMIKYLPKTLSENTPGSSITKLRKFYDSCMDLRASEEMAIPTALRYLEYFGIRNWPHLSNNYSFTKPSIDEILVRFSLYSLLPFFRLEGFKDEEIIGESRESAAGEAEKALTVKANSNGRNFLIAGDDSPDEKKDVIEATLGYFDLPETDAEKVTEDVFSFDRDLHELRKKSFTREEECEDSDTVSCSDNYYDCTQQKSHQEDRWCNIVWNFLNVSGLLKKHRNVRIELADKQYFHELGELMDHTNHRTVSDALALKFFVDNAAAMNYLIRRKGSFRDMATLNPLEMSDIPSVYCAEIIARKTPVLLASAFHLNIYKEEVHNEVTYLIVNRRSGVAFIPKREIYGSGLQATEIFLGTQEHLVSIVNSIPYMNRDEKHFAEKLLLETEVSGLTYLQHISNLSAVDSFYEELQITEESFLANDVEAKKFLLMKAIQSLDDVQLLSDLSKTVFVLDPTYDGRINIEIGSFIFPFISVKRPRYSNLGYFGNPIGHEISHALEQFLSDYENKSERYVRDFENKRKCLSDQFSAYEIDQIGVKVDGNHTLEENLADYFGLRSVFKYLMKYQEGRGFEERLPGVPFDNEQIFFVSFAQFFCEANTLASLQHYTRDNHSPAKQRILGLFKNFPPFSDSFSCPLGSPMNPVRKCNFEL